MAEVDEIDVSIHTQGKEAFVRTLFDNAANHYDRSSTIISLGMFPRWHRAAIGRAKLQPGENVLDVACGTGCLTLLAAEVVGASGTATGLDFSEGMLDIARRKAGLSPYGKRMTFLQGNAMALPFRDNLFDCVTMAFALRNVADPGQVLLEMVRVAKPGGRVVHMDIAIPTNWFMHVIYQFHMTCVMKVMDWIGDRLRRGARRNHRYQYLHKSQSFAPDRASLAAILTAAGLDQVEQLDLFGGCVVIFSGVKR